VKTLADSHDCGADQQLGLSCRENSGWPLSSFGLGPAFVSDRWLDSCWCDTKNGAASLNRAILWLQLAKAFRMKITEKNESTAVDVAGNLWQIIGWIESTPVFVTNPVPRLNHATARTQTFQNP
jgi:hypothetical protein